MLGIGIQKTTATSQAKTIYISFHNDTRETMDYSIPHVKKESPHLKKDNRLKKNGKRHTIMDVSVVFLFLLLMTSLSPCNLKSEQYIDELPRIVVYEYYYYRVYDATVLDPTNMTQEELESFNFRHSNGSLFEYIGEIKIENSRVFVKYSLGNLITVFSIHEFSNGSEISAEAVVSEIYRDGKDVRSAAYSDFKILLTSELKESPFDDDDQVPLIYTMVKDNTTDFKKTDFKKDISEAKNEEGQVIAWIEPFPYNQALYIVNAYPLDESMERGGFEADNTFLWSYTNSIVRAWGTNTSEIYWKFLQDQMKIFRNNLGAIEQDFWAKISFLPYITARYSNYRMMYNRDKVLYFQEFPIVMTAENTKNNLIFKIYEENLNENEEFQNLLLDHADYVYENLERDDNRLKEYRVLYQNIIDDFDMLYFSLGAAVGIVYVLFKIFSWAYKQSRIDGYIPKHVQQYVLQVLGYSVIAFGISLLIYDFYVINNILSQNSNAITINAEFTYNPGIFYIILLLSLSIVSIIVLRKKLIKRK